MQDESPFEKISRLETYLDENSQLDFVICPELFISGYGSYEKIRQYSETSDGDYANKIASLAKKPVLQLFTDIQKFRAIVFLIQPNFLIQKAYRLSIIAKKCCHQPRTNQKYLHLARIAL